MSKEPTDSEKFPLCGHLDALVDDLRGFVQAALEQFDEDAIHRARVTTRRLKAALDLLDTCLDSDHQKPFAKLGRRLRQRLGPMRDIDVMLSHLDDIEPAAPFAVGAEWFRQRLIDARDKARSKSAKNLSPSDVLAKLGSWWGLRQDVIDAQEAVPALLAESVHLQLDRFIEHADRINEITGALPRRRDPHELRIAGKALRYTLEIADANGHALAPMVLKTFKKMQDSLGTWHDFVVLAERAMQASLDEELPLHDPTMQRQVLLLIDHAMNVAAEELEQFGKHWGAGGAELSATIRNAFPLTGGAGAEAETLVETVAARDADEDADSGTEANATVSAPVSATVIESKTDRDPSGSDGPPAAEAASTDPSPDA